MTIEPAGNSWYELTCAGLPAGALGSGSGMMARSVVVYTLCMIKVCDQTLELHLQSWLTVFLWFCILYFIPSVL
jgi:hypothetical protein